MTAHFLLTGFGNIYISMLSRGADADHEGSPGAGFSVILSG